MADYVSKYTGSEVDGILDEAIELPQCTDEDVGKFLKYGDNGLEWNSINGLPAYSCEDCHSILVINAAANPTWLESYDASYGDVLKYNGSGFEWGPSIDIDNAHDGDFLKYERNGGLTWENPIDTTYANDGEFLKYSSTTGVMWTDPPTDSFGYLAGHGWNGALLSCVDNSPSWVNVRSALSDIIPTYDTHNNSSDTGKILTVLNNGSLGWVSPNQ